MTKPTVAIFIDTYHPRKDKTCKVSIRVTHQRIKRYYPTDITLSESDFNRILKSERRKEFEKVIYNRLMAFELKANNVVSRLPIFTFSKFEELYLENRNSSDSIFIAFDRYIRSLIEENRIGTATSYQTAKNSLYTFNKELKFADINKQLLQKYEKWLLDKGRSRTTVGIYIRPIKVMFNYQKIDRTIYPFGSGNDKYTIPKGRNIKKALNIEEIEKIFNYKPKSGSTEEMARDYWIFIYMCNGINVKDLCLLKRKNISEKLIEYERSKTKRSKSESELIRISLKEQALNIIRKWGQPSINSESYIFPHLSKGLSAIEERKIYQQLTKTINKYMKRIADKLEIKAKITTSAARHSFATILLRSGANSELIQEALGHSDLKTTKNYLAGFEDDYIHKATEALINFK